MSTFSPAEQEYARLDALLEAVPLAVAVFDGALQLAATNARYRDLTGVDVTQAVGRSVYDAFPNALADLTEQVDIAAGGVPVVSVRVPFQYRGGRRLVEATFSPLLDARGGRGLLFAGSDITEREGLREDLARSVAQLESIFDVLPDSVRVVDAEGGTVRTNAQAQQEHSPGNPQTLRELMTHDWPGNVRELEHVIERGVIVSTGSTLQLERDVPAGGRGVSPLADQVTASERAAIETALASSRGRVSGPRGAARQLDMPASTLEFRIRKLGIDKFKFRRAL